MLRLTIYNMPIPSPCPLFYSIIKKHVRCDSQIDFQPAI